MPRGATPSVPAGSGFERPPAPAATAATPRGALAGYVYATIRADLLAGRIAPGSRLNLDALARTLHVSNTPIRQALASLAVDGLVTRVPHRGYRASALLDIRSVEELYEYRRFVEPPTAAGAARRADERLADELRALTDPAPPSPGSARQTASGTDGRSARDAAFHLVLARGAGNTVVAEALERALGRTCQYHVYDDPGAAARTAEEHRAIAEAVIAGDPEGAGAAMLTHLTRALARLRDAVS